jgi:hypothetical protein
MSHACLLSVLLGGLVLAFAASAQDKGISEKDCRSLNFPASEQRLIRACNSRFNLCAAPPPTWTQQTLVMQVCQQIQREQQLQGAVGAPRNGNIVAPARPPGATGAPGAAPRSQAQPGPGVVYPPPLRQ